MDARLESNSGDYSVGYPWTDLPPLTLAIVRLEKTLVVGDAVLTEHEAVVQKNEMVSDSIF